MIVYLFRYQTSDQGTEGILATQGFFCKTLELPFRENKKGISCIPSGVYNTVIRSSPKFGSVYHVTEVENRSYILIHSGNFAGDVSKGFKSNVNGCILLGKDHGYLGNQRAILNSRLAVRAFQEFMGNNSFELHIVGGNM